MAVLRVRSVRTPGAIEGTFARNWVRTYSRMFRVYVDNRTDGPVTVSKAVDPTTGLAIPQVGNSYAYTTTEADRGSFVETVNCKLEALTRTADYNGQVYAVTVGYGPYDASDFPEDPTTWPLIVWWGASKHEKVIDKDIHGLPLLNSAGDPFVDPPMQDDSRPVLFVQRNEWVNTFDPRLADDLNDSINNAVWNTYPQYAVKFQNRTLDKPTKAPYSGQYYYTCVYSFELDRNKWKKEILDSGFAVLDTSVPPRQVKLLGTDGQPIGEAAPLDGNGQRLPEGDPPVYHEFDVYQESDFTLFNMDLSKSLGR